MADSIHDRVRRIIALYYAAEIGSRAGHDELSVDLPHRLRREAGQIHDSIVGDIAALDDADQRGAAAGALDTLRSTAARLARLSIAGKACLAAPAASGVREDVRVAYASVNESADAVEAEQVAAAGRLVHLLG